MEGQKCSKLLNLNQGDLQISGQIFIKLKNLIASLMKMLELTNFGHMTTSWTEITSWPYLRNTDFLRRPGAPNFF